MKILGRDPATILAFVSAGIQMLVAFGLDWDNDQTAAVNAAVAALLGVVTAFFVARDQFLPAIVGFTQAILTCGLAFGLNWSADQVAMVMAFVAAAVGLFGVRPQVDAVVTADGARVSKVTPIGPPGT
ncbi:hypothetical protein [Actinomadura rudentiformis]|uniref:Uncharacterized protein n=1 Tax=Actinomadura rudentiformis TaxID=359158 RepID=A0A6H9YUM3_9ACTN|nr:hypothetical protein [Actinomadura rudentiformis]KAB2347366.1 hypothetical protein F8566_20350 [Actinomadura rudentiformis]